MENKPRVIVFPYPAQGHVMPLMKLSCCLVDQGFSVTFVNTESIHTKLVDSLSEKGNHLSGIDMVAIPDGLTLEECNNPLTLLCSFPTILPSEFEKLIRNIMESNPNEKIVCVIADVTIGWALEVAKRMGIRGASFVPASAAIHALVFNIPKLIEMGVIDKIGTVQKDETICLNSLMPAMKTVHFVWHCMGDSQVQQAAFQVMLRNREISYAANWVLCNSSYELEHAAVSLVPNLLPIGPLISSHQLGNLWPEDSTCITWLDQQANRSVVYVAFGSIATHNKLQFDELAFALELLSRPFLWVVREDGTMGSPTTFPDGFRDRVASFGKIVSWAPQQKVLVHPSTGCFVSHCGWNSTMDGVSMGVPFISWPSFADQLSNGTYITDVWKVGLGLSSDGNSIVPRDEIRRKVDQVLEDQVIRENALKLEQMIVASVSEGGSSFKKFKQFVEEMKR